MSFHNFRIKPKEGTRFYDVEMDGKALEGVRDVDISMSVTGVPTVKLTMYAGYVDAELTRSLSQVKIVGEESLCLGMGSSACESCDLACPYR